MKFAITGTGVVSPLGTGTDAFIKAVRNGHSAIRPLPESLGISIGAHFETPFVDSIEKKQAFLMDPVSRYAVTAAAEALAMASLSHLSPDKIGVVMGIGICGIETIDDAYAGLYRSGRKVNPFAIPKIMPAAPASAITMTLGIRGPSFCTTSACASSAHAIINGALWLQAGLLDAVIVGGAEAPFAYGLLQAWDAMQILADDSCRPFSLDRKGLVLGEGAAALVLERLDDARARRANIVAILQGFAANADAAHIVKPQGDSIVRVMQAALENAGVLAADIGHINAHGTGTELNDKLESHAIAAVFSNWPWVSATKGATGHVLGAAAALEAVICAHSLKHRWIPPTLNSLGRDAGCADIRISGADCINEDHRSTISNSFAFGGLNAALVFSAA